MKSQFSQLSSNDIEMIDFTNLGVIQESTFLVPKFIIGETYRLDTAACDGFEMKSDFYTLIGTIDDYHGTKIDSVIVKKINCENTDHIFTLSKHDCECLNIDYQKGLQLFPKGMNWVRHKETVPFNSNDLATVPLSDIDHTVRKILFKINGFSNYDNTYIRTPNNTLINAAQLMANDGFCVENLLPLSYDNMHAINNKQLFTQIVYPRNCRFKYNNCLDENNSIYLLVSTTITKAIGFDNKCGVPKKYLEHVSPDDMFSISWNNSNALTIQEYEDKKTQELERFEKLKAEETKRREQNKKLEKERLKKEKEQRNRIFHDLNHQIDYEGKLNETFYHLGHQIDDISSNVDVQIGKTSKDLDKEIEHYSRELDGSIDNMLKQIDFLNEILEDW